MKQTSTQGGLIVKPLERIVLNSQAIHYKIIQQSYSVATSNHFVKLKNSEPIVEGDLDVSLTNNEKIYSKFSGGL